MGSYICNCLVKQIKFENYKQIKLKKKMILNIINKKQTQNQLKTIPNLLIIRQKKISNYFSEVQNDLSWY